MTIKLMALLGLNGLGIASGIIPSAPFGTGGEICLCFFALVLSVMGAFVWDAVTK